MSDPANSDSGETWQELDKSEYDSVWDRFYAQFEFNPSVKSEDWPGIEEPVPSVTYSIADVYESDGDRHRMLTENLNKWALQIFRELLTKDEWLYALEWQSTGYHFFPHRRFERNQYGEWPIPVVPNGDYYNFLECNFEWGIIGHPWEQTMCLFGERLLAAVASTKPALFRIPVRSKQ